MSMRAAGHPVRMIDDVLVPRLARGAFVMFVSSLSSGNERCGERRSVPCSDANIPPSSAMRDVESVGPVLCPMPTSLSAQAQRGS
eukprot:10501056-Alexandrium_andersonii.AAC.1